MEFACLLGPFLAADWFEFSVSMLIGSFSDAVLQASVETVEGKHNFRLNHVWNFRILWQ